MIKVLRSSEKDLDWPADPTLATTKVVKLSPQSTRFLPALMYKGIFFSCCNSGINAFIRNLIERSLGTQWNCKFPLKRIKVFSEWM